MAEQFVGQQLLYAKQGYVKPELYYWQPPRSEAQAEVDFIYCHNNRIIPVEVKSGSRGSIKSLQSFVIRKKADLAIRLSSTKPSVNLLKAKMNQQSHDFTLLNIPLEALLDEY